MRHLCAAIAAWMLLLVSVPAGAVTPWNKGPTFAAGDQIAAGTIVTILPGVVAYWRPEDTAASPAIVVGAAGASVVWDDGPATENLTIEQASGDATTNGAWKTYGPPLVSTGDCATLASCAIRYLLPGTYRFDTTGAAVAGMLKVTGVK